MLRKAFLFGMKTYEKKSICKKIVLSTLIEVAPADLQGFEMVDNPIAIESFSILSA